jgi:hypothetical protein
MNFVNESIYSKWKVYILFTLEYVLLMLWINIIVEISFRKTSNFALNFDKAFDEFFSILVDTPVANDQCNTRLCLFLPATYS